MKRLGPFSVLAAVSALACTPPVVYQSATWVIAQDSQGRLIANNADGDNQLCAQPLTQQNLSWLLNCVIHSPNVPKTVIMRRGVYEFTHLPDSQWCDGVVPTSVADTERCHFVHMRDNVTVWVQRGATLVVPHGYRGSVFSFQDGVWDAAVIGGRITEEAEHSDNPEAPTRGERCGGATFEETQEHGQWNVDDNGCVLRRWRGVQMESLNGGEPNYNNVRDVIIDNADVGIDLFIKTGTESECWDEEDERFVATGHIAGNEFQSVRIQSPRTAFIRFRIEGDSVCTHGINRNYFDHVRGDAAEDTPLGARILGKANTFIEVKFWEVENRGAVNPDPFIAKIGNCRAGERGELIRDDAWNTLIVGGMLTTRRSISGTTARFQDCGVRTQIIDQHYHQVP